MRQARGLPVYTVGSCSVQGLRNLLSHVRAHPWPAVRALFPMLGKDMYDCDSCETGMQVGLACCTQTASALSYFALATRQQSMAQQKV